ncbi:MAG: SLOG family protein [Oscillospiraceae bacterium]
MTQSDAQNDTPWESSICITGHRFEKLPKDDYLQAVKDVLYYHLDYAVMAGFTHFYVGMAEGIDYISALHLFELRSKNPEIKVIGIQPCTDYEEFFKVMHYDLSHLREMQNRLDKIIVLSGTWKDKGVFLRRNKFMVQRSSAILAVCKKSMHSGSMYTLHYARKKGLAYCWIRLDLLPKLPATPKMWTVERNGF